MTIIDKPIKELLPYPNNPRINDSAVKAVANSIKQFGFKQPIVIDSANTIVAGHTRVKAAQRLGLLTVPCVIADDLTVEQIRAYRLADNKTAELADWDFDLLDIELFNIVDIDMADFGFDSDLDQSIDIDDDSTSHNTHDKQLIHCPKCGFEFGINT
jgi:ParB-like chromosome segregation protein Spo0J